MNSITVQVVITCDFKNNNISLSEFKNEIKVSYNDESDHIILNNNNNNNSINFCKLNPKRKIHKIVGCSEPLYNVDKMEALWLLLL